MHDLVRRAGNICVHVIAGEQLPEQQLPARPVVATDANRPPRSFALRHRLGRRGSGPRVSASSSDPLFGIENVDLIFLTAIVGIAVRYGLWPSLLATVVASLAYNFFFLPPIYTFTITDPTNIAAFVLFAVLSVVVSNLAARGRTQAVTAHERVRTVESLYAFSRKLAGAGTLDDVLWATAHQIAAMLKVRVVLLLPENGSIALKAGYPPEDTLDDADLAAAKWAWEKNRPAGRDFGRPARRQVAVPADAHRSRARSASSASAGTSRVRCCAPSSGGCSMRSATRARLAIERVHLVEDIERVRRVAETDRLRSALLTSISHDLKTPLAAVLGAAGALARSVEVASTTMPRPTSSPPSSTSRSASTASSPTCST